MSSKLRVVVCLLLLLSQSPLWAQDEIYLVEVIVFARQSQPDILYRWPGQSDIAGAIDFNPFGGASGNPLATRLRPSEPETTPLLPASSLFLPLLPEQLIMQREWDNLASAARLTPLVHLAWRQPIAAFGQPQPVRIKGGAVVHRPYAHQAGSLFGETAPEPVLEVDGTVALERGRYLHLRIDLMLNQPPVGRPPHRSDLDTVEHSVYYQSWRIEQRRQVTTDVVNYFDHQHFGLITLVKKWSDFEDQTTQLR